MPTDRKAVPRNDGDREALRILLVARDEMTTTRTAQINRLRALLLTGDDADRDLSRGAMGKAHLDQIARRRGRPDETSEQAVRRGEARRLAVAIRAADVELTANQKHLATWSTTSPRACWTARASARSAPPRPSCRSPTPAGAATRPRSPPWPAPARCRPAADAPTGTASTGAATGNSTAPCTPSC